MHSHVKSGSDSHINSGSARSIRTNIKHIRAARCNLTQGPGRECKATVRATSMWIRIRIMSRYLPHPLKNLFLCILCV